MLGTLNGALEVRGIRLDPEDISAEAEGIMRLRDRMPVLEEIIVHYRLRVPAEARETVDRALASHGAKCPTARSLEGAIKVTWTAKVEETPSPS
ncbi:OsmC family protein [Candidatus Palauibacter sp.]|uniref:OsmC family protein n=1 Tax=Candidatus Palauibacter sp. TaxID=3101350 RepID=UPI003B020F7C